MSVVNNKSIWQTLQNPEKTKPMRLVSDGVAIVQMCIMGTVALTEVLSLPLFSFYIPCMAILVVSGVAGIINSTQRFNKLGRQREEYLAACKHNELDLTLQKALSDSNGYERYYLEKKAKLKKFKRERLRHALKIAFIETPCILFGVFGLAATVVLTSAMMYNILVATNVALTIGTLIFAGWNGVKFFLETDPVKKKQRFWKFVAASLVFIGSAGGLALTIAVPEALLPASLVLIGTSAVMLLYFAWNSYSLWKKSHQESPSPSFALLPITSDEQGLITPTADFKMGPRVISSPIPIPGAKTRQKNLSEISEKSFASPALDSLKNQIKNFMS